MHFFADARWTERCSQSDLLGSLAAAKHQAKFQHQLDARHTFIDSQQPMASKEVS